jgi:membrane protein YdbS with pleckstrin-like domain
MPETPGKPTFSEKRRPQYRQISWPWLALIWVGFVAIMLLLWALISSSPINWTQGVVTALAGPTLAIGLLAWRMREHASQPSKDDFLRP